MNNEDSELEEFAPWLVLIITMIGVFLRVLFLGMKGMWLDETFSVWLASQSIPEMLQWIVRIDQHPPLYYLLLHYWMAFYGGTPYYARLLSVVLGAATIPVIYLIGKRISGVVVGLAAAMFLTFSLFNIYYAQETRMYTLLMLNASLAIYALVVLLTDPRAAGPIGSQFRAYLHAWRTSEPLETGTGPETEFSYQEELRKLPGWRGWIYRHRLPSLRAIETDLAWIVYIVFSAATLYSHNTAVFFLLAVNVYVLGLMLYQRTRKAAPPPAFRAPSLGNWVKAQAGILLLWLPWIFAFLGQASRVDQEFWLPKPTWEFVTLTLRTLISPSVPGLASQVVMWILGAVLCLGLVYYRKRLSIFVFLAALFTIPILGELIVSLRRPIFLDRTLIWITIPLFLLLGAGIALLRFRPLMVLVLGGLAAYSLFSSGDYYRFYQKEDWGTAAGYVANFAQKDDLLLFNSNFVVIPFDYYFKPFEQQYALQVERQGVPLDLFDTGNLEPRMTEEDIPGLLSFLRGHDRVWLVYSHDSYTDPDGLIPQALASQMKLTREREFYGGKVQLYETP